MQPVRWQLPNFVFSFLHPVLRFWKPSGSFTEAAFQMSCRAGSGLGSRGISPILWHIVGATGRTILAPAPYKENFWTVKNNQYRNAWLLEGVSFPLSEVFKHCSVEAWAQEMGAVFIFNLGWVFFFSLFIFCNLYSQCAAPTQDPWIKRHILSWLSLPGAPNLGFFFF